jgi:F0F1-type ATP synthase delta subunit
VGKSFDEQVHQQFSLTIAEELLQAVTEAKVSTTEAASLQRYLGELQAQIKALPVVTIRMAIIPSNDLLRSISKWFDAVMSEKTLVSYVLDSTVIGGAAIEWNGAYLDYSLKKQLAEKLKSMEKKEEKIEAKSSNV